MRSKILIVFVFSMADGYSSAFADTLTGSYNVTGINGLSFSSSGPSFNSDTNNVAQPFVESVTGGNIKGNIGKGPFASVTGDLNSGTMAAIASGALSSSSSTPSFAPGAGTSQVTYTSTISNNSQAIENYSFNFDIDGGTIQTMHPANAVASINATIQVNGQTAWYSQAALDNYAYTQTGTNLGYVISTPSSGNYSPEIVSFGDYKGNLVLQLAPGQSDTLTYTIEASTAYDGNSHSFYGGAYAQIGDALSGKSTTISLIQSPVPEPDSYALMAIGVSLMAGVVRLRDKRQSKEKKMV